MISTCVIEYVHCLIMIKNKDVPPLVQKLNGKLFMKLKTDISNEH